MPSFRGGRWFIATRSEKRQSLAARGCSGSGRKCGFGVGGQGRGRRVGCCGRADPLAESPQVTWAWENIRTFSSEWWTAAVPSPAVSPVTWASLCEVPGLSHGPAAKDSHGTCSSPRGQCRPSCLLTCFRSHPRSTSFDKLAQPHANQN